MTAKLTTSALFLGMFIFGNIQAQNKPISKLDKISITDFNPVSPVVDSNANAVILADIGSSEFEGNSSGNFTLIFKQVKRILLKNKNAFDEATVKVPIYMGNSSIEEEKFDEFEATTYNLENGQISETKLDKNAIFKEKYDRTLTFRKFTFSNIKVGSIIEYKFTIKSPYYQHLRSWNFQDQYPVLWSQYQVTIPPMFTYYPIRQGYLPYTIDSAKSIYKSYSVLFSGDANSSTQVQNYSGNAIYNVWAIKDVPGFKKEKYLSATKNYLSKISFQLHSIKWSESSPTRLLLKSWIETVENILKDENYKSVLEDKNGWLDDDIKNITKDTLAITRAQKIYAYVRDNFSCTDHSSVIWMSEPLKKIYQAKKGTVTDINMVLIAMLNHDGFDVHPVMLSTRENGRASESTAILTQYNYLIARLKVDSTFHLLDASENNLGFGKLTESCYNNSGRLLDKLPVLIPLETDSLKEDKYTSWFIVNNEKGEVEGSYNTNLGYFESMHFRERLSTKNPEDYLKELAKSYPPEIEITNMQIDSLKIFDDPVTIKYDMKLKLNDEDLVYFNPLFNDAWKSNPFTSAERLYPVEMPYKISETFNLNMEIPKGYKVDEMPKSTRVKLNDNEGMFEYISTNDGNRIQLRSRIILGKATFEPDDYETLRNFFAFIVKKQAEQIVFKKIK